MDHIQIQSFIEFIILVCLQLWLYRLAATPQSEQRALPPGQLSSPPPQYQQVAPGNQRPLAPGKQPQYQRSPLPSQSQVLTVHTTKSLRYPGLELLSRNIKLQPQTKEKFESYEDHIGGVYMIFLSTLAMREADFPAEFGERWYEASSVLVGSQHFVQTPIWKEIISCVTDVVKKERSQALFRTGLEVNKTQSLEKYHELGLYLLIRKKAKIYQGKEEKAKGVFGCSTSNSGRIRVWFTKDGEAPVEYDLVIADISERLWSVVDDTGGVEVLPEGVEVLSEDYDSN